MSITLQRIAIGIGVICSICCLLWYAFALGLALWFNHADRGKEQLTAKLDSLRAKGVPVDSQSLDAWYRKRTDDANTEAWLKVLETLKSPQFKAQSQEVETFSIFKQTSTRKGNQWPGEGPVRELLAQTAELREEIRQLSKARVSVRFPVQFQFNSSKEYLEYVDTFRQIARLIALELDAAIADRDSAQIMASSQTLLDLSEVIRGEPFIHRLLAIITIRGLAFAGLKEALEQNILESQDLELLAKSLSQEPPPFERFSDLVHGEIGFTIPELLTPINPSKKNPLTGSTDARFASTQDTLHYLEHMLKYEDIDGCSMVEAIEKQKGYAAQLEKEIKAAEGIQFREWYITRIIFPNWRGVITGICRDRQVSHMVLHGIAIRRYQKQFGEFPKDLAALKEVGFNTADYMPVGNLPMGYRLEEDGCTLWSTSPSLGTVTTPEPITLDPSDPNYPLAQQMLWKFAP